MESLFLFIITMIVANAFEKRLKRANNSEKNSPKKNKNSTSIDKIKKDQEKRKSSFKDILKEITKEIEEESKKQAKVKTDYQKEAFNSLTEAIGFKNKNRKNTSKNTDLEVESKGNMQPEDLKPQDLTKGMVDYEKDYKGSLNESIKDYKTIEEDSFYGDLVEESDEEIRLEHLREAMVIKEILDKPVSMR